MKRSYFLLAEPILIFKGTCLSGCAWKG